MARYINGRQKIQVQVTAGNGIKPVTATVYNQQVASKPVEAETAETNQAEVYRQ